MPYTTRKHSPNQNFFYKFMLTSTYSEGCKSKSFRVTGHNINKASIIVLFVAARQFAFKTWLSSYKRGTHSNRQVTSLYVQMSWFPPPPDYLYWCFSLWTAIFSYAKNRFDFQSPIILRMSLFTLEVSVESFYFPCAFTKIVRHFFVHFPLPPNVRALFMIQLSTWSL